MSIPSNLATYLDQRGARYEVVAHAHSRTSAETARSANVMACHLAKSVILEDDAGYVMAVIPADKAVRVGELARMLQRKELRLADEDRVAMLFKGCEPGAVPSIGMPWALKPWSMTSSKKAKLCTWKAATTNACCACRTTTSTP